MDFSRTTASFRRHQHLLPLLLFLLLSRFAEASRLLAAEQPQSSRYVKLFGSLGMECKCSDAAVSGSGGGGGSCSTLRCLPWKLH
ncbi:unnamed protein product [Cuscuta campestris]|uniref:Uncharacterized protein n=1 Tax=Cuscuta campestris TaxID=132261 RepID=A0A484MKU4_9ASTE|nr:unnamed protein product [Cuscuta campestris]